MVATGDRDPFYSPHRLTRPVGALLGRDVVTLDGLGHLAPHEDERLVRRLVARLDPT